MFNDEAHHCYQDRPVQAVEGNRVKLSKDEQEANHEARVWFKGIQAVTRQLGVKAVYDLSATPFYLKGSGWNEGYIFPWTVSDFSPMDAIESGVVKIPRTPVDDDSAGELVTYLRLWDHIGDKLPKRRTAAASAGTAEQRPLPPELEGALESLYRSYERSFEHWRKLAHLGETPPVFIVVCPNAVVSKMVHDWIAGSVSAGPDGEAVQKPGNLALFSNVVDGAVLSRPRTVLIDSVQLESGEPLSAASRPQPQARSTSSRGE